MRALKIVALVLVGIVVAGLGTSWWLAGSEDVPATSSYDVGLKRLRELARSMPGELPNEVRSELVAQTALPRGAVMAGESFDPQPMVHVVFQVRYPDGEFVLIDSAFDEETHAAMGANDQPFHADAWERVREAMTRAQQIVITHEHGDHISGIARHPDPAAIAPRVRLTREQLASDLWLERAKFPASLRAKLKPLVFDDAVAIAPGVVLKKAPGHSPGSQLVFVTLADGRELLFIGDVAWNMDALVELKYRPRFTTNLFLGEDRDAVLNQFRALHDLIQAGEVTVVVSHDPRARADYGLDATF